MPVDQRTLQNAENARLGIRMASARFEPPAEIAVATAMITEIERIQAEPAPELTDMPDDPAKLLAALRKHATASALHAAVLTAADTALDHYSRTVILGYRRVLPGWVDGLADDFVAEIATFRTALLDAPSATLSGFEDAEVVEAHMEVRRSAARLEA